MIQPSKPCVIWPLNTSLTTFYITLFLVNDSLVTAFFLLLEYVKLILDVWLFAVAAAAPSSKTFNIWAQISPQNAILFIFFIVYITN